LLGDLHHYISLHTSSPLHQAVNQGAFRISVSLLATRDHRNRTSTLFYDCIVKNVPRPTAQSLTGILRALLDHQATVDESRLKIYCSDQSLTRSRESQPSTHSSEILDGLYELVPQQKSTTMCSGCVLIPSFYEVERRQTFSLISFLQTPI